MASLDSTEVRYEDAILSAIIDSSKAQRQHEPGFILLDGRRLRAEKALPERKKIDA